MFNFFFKSKNFNKQLKKLNVLTVMGTLSQLAVFEDYFFKIFPGIFFQLRIT
jgi:hypothetical protein